MRSLLTALFLLTAAVTPVQASYYVAAQMWVVSRPGDVGDFRYRDATYASDKECADAITGINEVLAAGTKDPNAELPKAPKADQRLLVQALIFLATLIQQAGEPVAMVLSCHTDDSGA